MMCVNGCRGYRHEGPCPTRSVDRPDLNDSDYQEMARAFHELESERLKKIGRPTGREERKFT